MFNNNLLMGAAGAASGSDLVSVSNSALYVVGNDEYLSRTPGSGGSQTTWTFSVWTNGTAYFSADNESGTPLGASLFYYNSTELTIGNYNNSGGWTILKSFAPRLRDRTGWYNIVGVYDSSNAVEDDRIRCYINGVRYTTTTGTVHHPTSSEAMSINDTVAHNVGKWVNRSGFSNDGYTAETVFLDGTAVTDASSFGQFDSTGLYWTPKSSSEIKDLTFGTNGFYLDNTTNAQTDASGEGNNWTNNNTVTTVSGHTPTNISCLLNPLNADKDGNWSITNGNRNNSVSSASTASLICTLPLVDGAGWYWETKFTGSYGAAGVSTTGAGDANSGVAVFLNSAGQIMIRLLTFSKIRELIRQTMFSCTLIKMANIGLERMERGTTVAILTQILEK